MKISNIKVIVTCPGRNFTVVKVETDEGVYGVGEGTLNGSEQAVAYVRTWPCAATVDCM